MRKLLKLESPFCTELIIIIISIGLSFRSSVWHCFQVQKMTKQKKYHGQHALKPKKNYLSWRPGRETSSRLQQWRYRFLVILSLAFTHVTHKMIKHQVYWATLYAESNAQLASSRFPFWRENLEMSCKRYCPARQLLATPVRGNRQCWHGMTGNNPDQYRWTDGWLAGWRCCCRARLDGGMRSVHLARSAKCGSDNWPRVVTAYVEWSAAVRAGSRRRQVQSGMKQCVRGSLAYIRLKFDAARPWWAERCRDRIVIATTWQFYFRLRTPSDDCRGWTAAAESSDRISLLLVSFLDLYIAYKNRELWQVALKIYFAKFIRPEKTHTSRAWVRTVMF